MADVFLAGAGALIFAASALGALWCVSEVVQEWQRRGLTRSQLRYIRRIAARFRARNAATTNREDPR